MTMQRALGLSVTSPAAHKKGSTGGDQVGMCTADQSARSEQKQWCAIGPAKTSAKCNTCNAYGTMRSSKAPANQCAPVISPTHALTHPYSTPPVVYSAPPPTCHQPHIPEFLRQLAILLVAQRLEGGGVDHALVLGKGLSDRILCNHSLAGCTPDGPDGKRARGMRALGAAESRVTRAGGAGTAAPQVPFSAEFQGQASHGPSLTRGVRRHQHRLPALDAGNGGCLERIQYKRVLLG